MGTDFALACGDCLEFIELHKWSIIKEAGHCLVRYPDRCGEADLTHFNSSQPYRLQWVRHLSTQPLVPITAKQLKDDGLDNFIPPQPYIKKLLPVVKNFLSSHQDHFMFITCDRGELPWDFDEPRCFEWKEVQAAFNHQGRFLPRNLIEDYGFTKWSEVLKYYSKHQSWFLDEQMKEDREALRQAFEQSILP